MQRDTTLQFWDEYHNKNDSQEWISKPGEELLAMIFHHYWNQDQDQDHRHTSNIQVNNNDALTNDIVKNNDEMIKLLEIGCGTSTLVRDMKIHIENTYYYPRIIKKVIACGTDVSQVCIDVNQQRDGHNSGDLWYEVLNCLEDNNGNDDNGEQLSSLSSSSSLLSSSSFHHRGNWDLIIDKGCLDTFMFRSKKQGTNRIYPESVRKLLDNIHGWLSSSMKSSSSSSSLSTSLSLSSSDDGGERLEKEEEEVVVRNRRVGCYIFISPRSKVKAVRDYAGFSSVRRYPLPGNYRAELEGKKNNINNRSNNNNNTSNNNENNNENNNNITRDNVDDSNITSPPSSTLGYLFVCTKNINYKVGIEEPFPTAAATDHHGGNQHEELNDDTKCPKCGISFLEFRKGEGVEFRGNKFWTRTFKGHSIHCN
jgi:rubredoxin